MTILTASSLSNNERSKFNYAVDVKLISGNKRVYHVSTLICETDTFTISTGLLFGVQACYIQIQ